jgi:hypothetical protein
VTTGPALAFVAVELASFEHAAAATARIRSSRRLMQQRIRYNGHSVKTDVLLR